MPIFDNSSVDENPAFLKFTYEEYSKLKEIPKVVDLYLFIIYKDPFTELYNCGGRCRFKNEIVELNEIFKNVKLSVYKRFKSIDND